MVISKEPVTLTPVAEHHYLLNELGLSLPGIEYQCPACKANTHTFCSGRILSLNVQPEGGILAEKFQNGRYSLGLIVFIKRGLLDPW